MLRRRLFDAMLRGRLRRVSPSVRESIRIAAVSPSTANSLEPRTMLSHSVGEEACSLSGHDHHEEHGEDAVHRVPAEPPEWSGVNWMESIPESDIPTNGGPYDPADTFNLASKADSNFTIYLDFDGHTTEGTTWNAASGRVSIVTSQYSRPGDSDPNSFDSIEHEYIQRAWRRVAEDFAPFDVNVTTIEPEDLGDLRREGPDDTRWGTRVVITPDNWDDCGCGGFAYIGSFNDRTDEPSFVFNRGLSGVSEAITHEVGHQLYLSHDGFAGGAEYSGGHGGAGGTSWGPVMGAPYSRTTVQFSNNEYFNASNTGAGANFGRGVDDINVIVSNNGFGFRVDDHGPTYHLGTELTPDASGNVSANGIISQRDDVDAFRFETAGGQVSFTVDTLDDRGNLDAWIGLYDSRQQLIAEGNPSNNKDASVTFNVAAGRYYIKVDGVGTHGVYNAETDRVEDPTGNARPWAVANPTGYSDYGSLGYYTLTGTISAASVNSDPVIAVNGSPQRFVEGAGPVRIVPAATVTDADSPIFNGSVGVSITSPSSGDVLGFAETAGVLELRVRDAVTSDVIWNGTTVGRLRLSASMATVRLNGSATPEIASVILQAITYDNASTDIAVGTTAVELFAEDGDGNRTTVDTLLIRAGTPTASELVLATNEVSYVENAPSVFPLQGAMLTDGDGEDYAGGRLLVRLRDGYESGDRISIDPTDAVYTSGSSVFVDGTYVGDMRESAKWLFVEFTTGATTASVTAVLNAVAYSSEDQHPTRLEKTLEIVLRDPDRVLVTTDLGGLPNVMIVVQPENDPPRVWNISRPTTYRENRPEVLIARRAWLADPDSFRGGVVTATITDGGGSGDQLGLRVGGPGTGKLTRIGGFLFYDGSPAGNITQTADSISVSFLDSTPRTVARQIIRSLTYQNTSDNPVAGTRTITISYTDSAGLTGAGDAFVRVVPQNDPPRIEGLVPVTMMPSSRTYVARDGVVVDPDTTNFADGFFVVRTRAGHQAGDTLRFENRGQLTVSGSRLLVRGRVVGNIVIGRSNLIRVDFTSATTAADATAVVRSLTFGSRPSTGLRIVRLITSDGSNLSRSDVNVRVSLTPTTDSIDSLFEDEELLDSLIV